MKQNIKNKDKKKFTPYVAPCIKVIKLETTDIIATSNPDKYTTEFGDGGDI